MAYEKYIKRDGKIYGPYIYHSKRVGGKVVSEYHGQKKLDYKKVVFALPLVVLIIFGAYLIGNSQKKLTGNAVLDLNANYQEGKTLDGTLKVSLSSGELIPSDSTLAVENGEHTYNYNLGALVSDNTVNGSFFVEGKNLSGSGEGFGIQGEKLVYPEVDFVLLIYSPINQSQVESQTEIQGNVSVGNPFIYDLQPGQSAELKPLSVNSQGEQLPDNALSISTENGTVSVSTDYSQKEQGFGPDYNGTATKEINIDLGKLNLSPQQGNLTARIIYGGEVINSVTTEISSNGKISGDSGNASQVTNNIATQTPETTSTPVTQTQGQTTNLNLSQVLELTGQERATLETAFGNASLEITQATEKNGFIIIRYEIGGHWVEHSYQSDLSQSELQTFIQQDKTKFLKDLAATLSENQGQETNLTGYTGSYPY